MFKEAYENGYEAGLENIYARSKKRFMLTKLGSLDFLTRIRMLDNLFSRAVTSAKPYASVPGKGVHSIRQAVERAQAAAGKSSMSIQEFVEHMTKKTHKVGDPNINANIRRDIVDELERGLSAAESVLVNLPAGKMAAAEADSLVTYINRIVDSLKKGKL